MTFGTPDADSSDEFDMEDLQSAQTSNERHDEPCDIYVTVDANGRYYRTLEGTLAIRGSCFRTCISLFFINYSQLQKSVRHFKEDPEYDLGFSEAEQKKVNEVLPLLKDTLSYSEFINYPCDVSWTDLLTQHLGEDLADRVFIVMYDHFKEQEYLLDTLAKHTPTPRSAAGAPHCRITCTFGNTLLPRAYRAKI